MSRPPLWGPLNPPLRDWRGRVCWLVGASTGIGAATAQALHAAGAQVVVSARRDGPLQALVGRLPGALGLPLDVTDRAATARAAAEVVQACGRLDLVLYCAGTYRPMRASAFDLDSALAHDDINYRGALHLLDAVLPTLLAQGHGHLSLVASVAGYGGLPHGLAYGPTKAALQHLAQGLWLDLRPHGIGVSVVNPGFVDTPLTAQNHFKMPALMRPEDAAAAMLGDWAAGRFESHHPKRFTRWLKALQWLPHPLYFALVQRATGG